MPPSVPAHIRELAETEIRNAPRRLVRVIDYLLVTTDDHGGRVPAGWAGPVDLATDIQIQRLDDTLAERLRRATELRGENWEHPPRLRAARLGGGRRRRPGEPVPLGQ